MGVLPRLAPARHRPGCLGGARGSTGAWRWCSETLARCANFWGRMVEKSPGEHKVEHKVTTQHTRLFCYTCYTHLADSASNPVTSNHHFSPQTRTALASLRLERNLALIERRLLGTETRPKTRDTAARPMLA